MRNKIIPLGLLLLNFVLFSCKDDVTGADDNVKKTLLTYNKVLSDQTHNVIMPLKVGNKWYYFIDGDSTKIDSIVVLKEIDVNGTKWFRTKLRSMTASMPDTANLINTDTGLWMMCDTCRYDFAPYPVNTGTVHFRSELYTYPLYGNKNDSTIINFYYDISVNQPIQLFNKKTSGIKYEGYYDALTNSYGKWEYLGKARAGYNMYFIPDSGLINFYQYEKDTAFNIIYSSRLDLKNCIINR